ncbi:MAG TPA: YbbR-like domain-containing protein [Oligoflexia bacterium]|nr:YbbR-like domain-containing protein [Oligoflexia bacterium]HMP27619.1 YbbR-like domain-containing protein [Oligoflexia bacterium]
MKNLKKTKDLFFSLGVAVFLAYYVRSSINESTVTLELPIELNSLPENKVVISEGSSYAEVVVRGPSHLIAQYISMSKKIKLKLPENLGSKHRFVIDKTYLNLPSGISLISIKPAVFEMEFDELRLVSLPIKLNVVGKLSKGLELISQECFPKSVRVTAPSKFIKDLKVIQTEPINLSEVFASGEYQVGLLPPFKQVSLQPQIARVVFEIINKEQKGVKAAVR